MLKRPFNIIFRFAQIVFFVGLIPIALGFIFGGNLGVLATTLLTLIFITYLFFTAERRLTQAFDGSFQLPLGLDKSLHYAIDHLEIPYPKIAVYSDSAPNILMVRGPGSHGTLLLSQGLLATLSETELRSLLCLCSVKALEQDLPVRTLAGFLALWFWERTHPQWLAKVFTQEPTTQIMSHRLTAFSALPFLLMTPYLKKMLQLSKSNAAFSQSPSIRSAGDPTQETQEIALLKISQAISTGGVIRKPATAFLYLVDPWSSRSLIPLS